ncbi:MAG: hypothetical protein K8T25_04145 [Planctomycetia bacterium]|nr:hypothetical protein [Planctomycetia bacterium]
MLIATLIVLNIPLYLFIGWVAFDSGGNAADTFLETIVNVLKILFIPWWVRMLTGMETTGAIGMFPILGYFIACGAITYGEWWVVMKMFWPHELRG